MILKRAPATIIGLTALFVIPLQVLGAFLGRGTDGILAEELVEEGNATVDFGPTLASGASALVVQLGSMLALVVVAAAIARLVSAWYVGHDLTTSELLRATLPLTWALFASCVLVHLLEAVAIVGLVLPLAVMTWFLVTAPVIGAERVGPIRAMRRSVRLVNRRFWPVLGAALLGYLVELLFVYAIGLLPLVASLFIGTEGIAWVIPAAVGVATQLITMPFVASVTVLIYLDLRVRTEGLDLELRAGEAFPAT